MWSLLRIPWRRGASVPPAQPERQSRTSDSAVRAARAAAARAAERDAEQVGGLDDSWEEERRVLSAALPAYEIVDRIRSGGQGVVYRAIQRSTRRVVAIKVLLNGPLATRRERFRFQREVEIVSRLRHPNIVSVHDSGVVHGRDYVVMEHVDGLPIHDFVLLNRLGTREVVALFVRVCRAVAYAHQNGVIHRDLKPSNILVDRDGQPRILDFGLAKDLCGSGETISAAGHFVGTVPYCSPEHFGELDGRVDILSDVYSLGVVLFELLTEELPCPFDGDPNAAPLRMLAAPPRRLRQALDPGGRSDYPPAAGITDELEVIVAKALAREKAQRYQSAGELADDLERYLAGEAIHAKADSRWYVLVKLARRHRVAVAAAAGGLVVLAAALAGTTAAWRQAERTAATYQKALQLGALLRLGSAARDEGRLQQARDLLEAAAEIAATLPSADLDVRRLQFHAHQLLADLHAQAGRIEPAEAHCRAALDLAQGISREFPGRLEFHWLLALSHGMRGQIAASRNDWGEALEEFAAAVDVHRMLVEVLGSDEAMRNLAWALEWQSQAHRMLSQFEQSLDCLSEAHELRSRLFEANSDDPDRRLSFVGTVVNLAAWHLAQRWPADDLAACELLEQAEALIREPLRDGRLDAVRAAALEALDAIERNRRVLDRR